MVHQVVKVAKVAKVMIQLPKVIIVQYHGKAIEKLQGKNHSIAPVAVRFALDPGHMNHEEIKGANIHNVEIAVTIHGIDVAVNVVESVHHLDDEANQLKDDETIDREN